MNVMENDSVPFLFVLSIVPNLINWRTRARARAHSCYSLNENNNGMDGGGISFVFPNILALATI